MMEYTYDLPVEGCNVFYGTYLDNYSNSVRKRYYLNDGQLVMASSSSYSRLPDGVHCLVDGEKIVYKPELEIYFNTISVISLLFVFWFAYNLIVPPFWRKK